MTLVVQSDEGDEVGANGYIDLVFFKAYHDDRGNDYSAFTDEQLEYGVIEATSYMDLRWRALIRSKRLLSTQTTEFPRYDLYDELGESVEGIPVPWKEACAEYSLRAASRKLLQDAPRPLDASGNIVASSQVEAETIKAGPIELTTRYGEYQFGASSAGGTATTCGDLLPAIPAADLRVERYLKRSGSQRRAIR